MILTKDAFGIKSLIFRKAFKATFKRQSQEIIKNLLREGFVGKEVGIYIHFPFCRGLCPACPYVRYLWDDLLVKSYLRSLKLEISAYRDLLQDLELKITEVHVGGGTPSCLDPKQYKEIIEALGESFSLEGASIGIEANPEDLTEERIYALMEAGVNELSLGVQSFFRENIRLLGRRHSVEDSIDAIENLEGAGFRSVNIDMMYMLPGQTIEDWVEDLRIALEFEPAQITAYPLLVVSYRPMYKMMMERRVQKQPSMREFRKMYYEAINTLEEAGYTQVRYYSFSKTPWEYSTVEKEMTGPLLAFGPGAMGFPGKCEYINTCSVRGYVKSLSRGRLPVAGIREVNKEERGIRWISERLSALELKFEGFKNEFGEEFWDFVKRTGFSKSLFIQRLLGHIKIYSDRIELTKKGLFSRNLGGWAFVLSVPCRIVEEYLRTPWPREVTVP
ncbi:MAG: hypothetical protein DRN92_02180 [Thermoproteota archaeon]|nr:MAG: hypothetical protein DRN92_02180 [Candidatus Korarchaeota archaeon]